MANLNMYCRTVSSGCDRRTGSFHSHNLHVHVLVIRSKSGPSIRDLLYFGPMSSVYMSLVYYMYMYTPSSQQVEHPEEEKRKLRFGKALCVQCEQDVGPAQGGKALLTEGAKRAESIVQASGTGQWWCPDRSERLPDWPCTSASTWTILRGSKTQRGNKKEDFFERRNRRIVFIERRMMWKS